MGKSRENKALRESKADKKLALGLGVKRKQLKRKKGTVIDGAIENEDAAGHGVVEDKELVGTKKNILAKQKRKNKHDKVTSSHNKVDLVELRSDSKDGATAQLKKQKNKKKLKEGNSHVKVQKSPVGSYDSETLKLEKKKKKKFKEGNSPVEVHKSLLHSSDAETLKLKKKKKRKVKEEKTSVEPSDAEDILHENQDSEILNAGGNQPPAQSEVLDIEDPEKARRRKKNKTKKVKESLKISKEDTHVSKKENKLERHVEVDTANVDEIASVDEDCSKGMKKWIVEYKNKRPGLKVLQRRIDEFITSHEEQQEQERKEREARAAGDGWTVVVHHKGRKKTTDTETGTAVGSVSLAAMHAKISKKQPSEVGPNFYRFQRREAHITELAMLQSKFEQDKKRIQQLRAQRKFKPY